MIVLNGEKELVRVESWDDIVSRPGFNADLNPQEHELSAIIAQYSFADYIPCGLSNCHTPHSRGYVVATKSGQETNIGKDCGKNYFGVDFQTMSNKFDRDIRDKEARERIWSFYFRLDETKNKIAELRNGDQGGDWVFKNALVLHEPNRSVPKIIVRTIIGMVKTRDSILRIDEEATGEEYAFYEARNGQPAKKPYMITRETFDIQGLEVFYEGNSIKDILILDLEENIKVIEKLRIDELISRDLDRWSKWIGTVENSFDRAHFAIERGRALLRKSNLNGFAKILRDDDDQNLFAEYLAKLPE